MPSLEATTIPEASADDSHPHRAAFFSRLKPLAAGWFAAGTGASYGMPMQLADGARSFDISPAWHSWVGMAPALELLLNVGIDRIHVHDLALANRFRTGLGLEESNSAIVAIDAAAAATRWPGVVDRLDEAGVRYSQAGGNLRFDFHLYNDDADVDQALSAMTRMTRSITQP